MELFLFHEVALRRSHLHILYLCPNQSLLSTNHCHWSSSWFLVVVFIRTFFSIWFSILSNCFLVPMIPIIKSSLKQIGYNICTNFVSEDDNIDFCLSMTISSWKYSLPWSRSMERQIIVQSIKICFCVIFWICFRILCENIASLGLHWYRAVTGGRV